MILMNDFRRSWTELRTDLTDAFAAVGESGYYVLGGEVSTFERDLATHWGIDHAVGVGNGMDALEIGLRTLGLKPGQRVLTTPLSAFATGLAILRAGGEPVLDDVDQHGLIDFDRAAEILERDRSIKFFMPVHLYGLPLDVDRLEHLKQTFDLKVVEDCAQSIGAYSRTADGRRRPTGSVGQAVGTSFYPTKNLGAIGDGGAVLLKSSEHAEVAKRLRNYGQSERYVHTDLGLNSRLDELQAALLRRVILPKLAAWTDRRRQIAAAYSLGINHPLIRVATPTATDEPCWHLYPLFVTGGREPRARLAEHLRTTDVASGFHYPILIPDQAALAGRYDAALCPRARELADGEISIPIHPYLRDDEVESVITAVNQFTK